MLETVTPTNAIEAARHMLALEHLADLRRLDEQMADYRRRIKAAVAAAYTSVTDVFGVGPIVAAIITGYGVTYAGSAPPTTTPTPAPLP